MRTRWFLTLLLLSSPAAAAVFRVGDTNADSCDFASIQDAIDAALENGPGADTIVVANSGSYSGVALTVGDQSLAIVGGWDSCAHQAPAAAADIGGNGADPVLRIAPEAPAAQSVTLSGVRLHDGGVAGYDGSSGGGVYVTNNVVLTVAESTIENNFARSGGGIYVDGSIGHPYVKLHAGATIRRNFATYYGGGVYVDSGNLGIAADRVLIGQNTANDGGGGIASINGVVEVGAVDTVTARYDATGASISGNTAGVIGGGLMVYGPYAALYANELIVDGNSAGQGGGGIAAGTNAYVWMARDYATGYKLQCPNARECSRLSANSVGTAAGGAGGALALYSGARADIAQTIVRGNVAQDGSVAFVDGATLSLEGVLATANRSADTAAQTGAAIRTRFLSPAAATLKIAYSTFAANLDRHASGDDAPALDIIAQQYSTLAAWSSVLADAYNPITTYSAWTDDCVAVAGLDYYGSHARAQTTLVGAFNDATHGDFRLRSPSPLNDYCDASKAPVHYRDLLLATRCHDDPMRPDAFGACDIGALESDHIFGDGMD